MFAIPKRRLRLPPECHYVCANPRAQIATGNVEAIMVE